MQHMNMYSKHTLSSSKTSQQLTSLSLAHARNRNQFVCRSMPCVWVRHTSGVHSECAGSLGSPCLYRHTHSTTLTHHIRMALVHASCNSQTHKLNSRVTGRTMHSHPYNQSQYSYTHTHIHTHVRAYTRTHVHTHTHTHNSRPNPYTQTLLHVQNHFAMMFVCLARRSWPRLAVDIHLCSVTHS